MALGMEGLNTFYWYQIFALDFRQHLDDFPIDINGKMEFSKFRTS